MQEVTFVETPKTVVVPPPAAPAAPIPAPTPEQIEQAMKSAFGESAATAPKAPAAPPAVPPVTPAPEAPPVAPAVPPVAASPVIEPPATAAPTPAPTAREIAHEVVAEMGAPATPPSTPEFKLNADDQSDYDVLCYLEKAEPEKWKGQPAAFIAYVKLLYAYMENWQKHNPGETYDADAKEHEDWYAKNQPDIDPEDIKAGRVEMKAEERAYQRVAPELNRIKAERAMAKATPVIQGNVHRNILSFVEQVDPELAKLVKSEDGRPNFSKENIALVEAKDAIANEIMDNIAGNFLAPLIHELELSAVPDIGFALNPAVNQKHAMIDHFRQQAEKALLDGPAANRTRDGKEFRTLARMAEIQRAASGKADELNRLDDNYWTLTVDDLQAEIVKHYAQEAKGRIEKQDALAQKKYKPANGGGQPAVLPPVVQPPVPPTPTAPPSAKPTPPSIASASEVVTTPAAGAAPQKTVAESAVASAFRR